MPSRKKQTRKASKPTRKRAVQSSLLRSLGVQAAIAASALVVLSSLSYVERGIFATLPGQAEGKQDVTTEIAVEFEGKAAMQLTFARKGTAGFVRIDGDALQKTRVSLPAEWTRAEVYGATLSEITREEPQLGFTRWTIPAGAGMRMTINQIPDVVTFLTPGSGIASLDIASVDLLTGETNRQAKILQTETSVALWSE